MRPVLDVGAGESPDPRADETADIRPGCDHRFDVTEEWPLRDEYASGLTLHHVVEHVGDPWHVYREAARVLTDGGWLEVTVPLGWSQDTDPDHEWRPTYEGLARFADAGRQPWDPNLPFALVRRDVAPRLGGPLADATPLLQLLARRWPAWACWHADHGEMTARYRRDDR